MEQISVNFEGRHEVLDVIERRDELIDHFKKVGTVASVCKAIDIALASSKRLGSGVAGEVFRIKVKGRPSRLYAVKKTSNKTINVALSYYNRIGASTLSRKSPITLGELYDLYYDRGASSAARSSDLDTTREMFVDFNGGDPERVINSGDMLFIPSFESSIQACKTERGISIMRYVMKKGELPAHTSPIDFQYPIGSYVCNTPGYTEYVLGMIASSIFERGECANFTSMFGFSTCSESIISSGYHPSMSSHYSSPHARRIPLPRVYDYTFMEFIKGTPVGWDAFEKMFLEPPSDDDEDVLIRNDVVIACVLIQTIFAISIMQRKYGIQHNDLHLGNVMIQTLSPKHPTSFGSEKDLHSADYFSYTIDGRIVYLPNLYFVVKIVDFGYASKYSDPIVCRSDIVYREGEFSDAAIPGWRDDFYDISFFVFAMMNRFSSYGSIFLKTLFLKMVDPWGYVDLKMVWEDSFDTVIRDLKAVYTYSKNSSRPALMGLAKHPWEYLLDQDIVKDIQFGQHPDTLLQPGDEPYRIVSLGVLEKNRQSDRQREGAFSKALYLPKKEVKRVLENHGLLGIGKRGGKRSVKRSAPSTKRSTKRSTKKDSYSIAKTPDGIAQSSFSLKVGPLPHALESLPVFSSLSPVLTPKTSRGSGKSSEKSRGKSSDKNGSKGKSPMRVKRQKMPSPAISGKSGDGASWLISSPDYESAFYHSPR